MEFEFIGYVTLQALTSVRSMHRISRFLSSLCWEIVHKQQTLQNSFMNCSFQWFPSVRLLKTCKMAVETTFVVRQSGRNSEAESATERLMTMPIPPDKEAEEEANVPLRRPFFSCLVASSA